MEKNANILKKRHFAAIKRKQTIFRDFVFVDL